MSLLPYLKGNPAYSAYVLADVRATQVESMHPDVEPEVVELDTSFRSIDADSGFDGRMLELFAGAWPAYQRWYLSQGEASRPTYAQCAQAIRTHMPELAPTFDALGCERRWPQHFTEASRVQVEPFAVRSSDEEFRHGHVLPSRILPRPVSPHAANAR